MSPDETLLAAYQATAYVVLAEDGPLEARIGAPAPPRMNPGGHLKW